MSMEKNKSPGDDGLTKEFFCSFLGRYKGCFIKFMSYSKTSKGIKHFAKTGYHETN